MTGTSTFFVLYDHLSGHSEIISLDDIVLPGSLYSAETAEIFRGVEFSPRKMIINELLVKAGL